MEDIKQLTEIFRKLGAENPERWARSQVEEGIPQLARFLFLKQAWKLVVGEHDEAWIPRIQSEIATTPHGPGAAIGTAIDRLLAQGANRKDLTTVVRVMQWRLLAGLCYLLDDPGQLGDDVPETAWRLFQVDDNDEPISVIAGLHESVLETDPAGHEMSSDAHRYPTR